MQFKGYSAALKGALGYTRTLSKLRTPAATCLWATKKLKTFSHYDEIIGYVSQDQRENGDIFQAIEAHVAGCADVRLDLEKDYLGKFYEFRNWYLPKALAQLADLKGYIVPGKAFAVPWFNFGKYLPKGYFMFLEQFWERVIPNGYKPLNLMQITCPKSDANTGIAYTSDGWIFSGETGPHWNSLLEGAVILAEELARLAPSWRQVMDPRYRNPALESICVDVPALRLESGPLKARWTHIWPKTLYIIERAYSQPLLEVWLDSPYFIGKASHCKYIGRTYSGYRGKPMVFTHGDDWVAADGQSQFLSGDWGYFDLTIRGIQQVASYKALSDALKAKGSWSAYWDSILRSLAYLASKAPTMWPFARRHGKYVVGPSVRRLEGKVRSGKGDFKLHEDAMNTAALRVLLAKGFQSWDRFAVDAWDKLGWIAKPDAQGRSPNGFLSCRCAFMEEDGYQPLVSVASAIRNWVRPAYDPNDALQATRVMLVTRLRDLAVTLTYTRDGEWDPVMGAVVKTAVAAGVQDPYGAEYSNAELARCAQFLHRSPEYTMSHFLQA